MVGYITSSVQISVVVFCSVCRTSLLCVQKILLNIPDMFV
jgi:hypothetical protein